MTISVTFDLDTGLYELLAHVPGMSASPCGPRIFRGPPHPAVKFAHETKAAAETDAGKIRDYLANLPTRKPSKKEIQQQHD